MRQRKSGLVVPERQITRIKLHAGHLTKFGEEMFGQFKWEKELFEREGRLLPPIAGGGSFSNAYETAVLEHITGKKTLTLVTPMYLALATTVPTVTTTGVTIVEATYTGYARKSMEAAAIEAAVAGTPSSIKNGSEEVFVACTGSTSTIIGWALTDKSETAKGAIAMWGSATSTVISTTQTPASIAAKAIELTLA